jgi:hypothetical protein
METIRRNKKFSNGLENSWMRMKLFKRDRKQSEEIKNFQTDWKTFRRNRNFSNGLENIQKK